MDTDLAYISRLGITPNIFVTSKSAIKIHAVERALLVARPGEKFTITGVKSNSGVAEQPLGQIAIDGALNRLNNAMAENSNPETISWISVENGLFRISSDGEDVDLSTEFEPGAEYEDRAVVAVSLPRGKTVVTISPKQDAVTFPKVALDAAFYAPGSFAKNTAGSKLAEMGLVKDKQDPHAELTLSRPDSPLTREDQMARTIVRALVSLTHNSNE